MFFSVCPIIFKQADFTPLTKDLTSALPPPTSISVNAMQELIFNFHNFTTNEFKLLIN